MNDTPTRGQRERLASIHRFDQLVAYLRDELDWPISRDSFEDVDDLFYEFTPDELGIDARNAAKIESIKRLRPLSADQPWGIFFVKFEPRRLPVVALRRLLGAVALKKRASANPADRQAWAADDLLFVSNYGEDEERRISFAHFTPGERAADLPTLKVLGWDGQDTALHLDQVANTLHRHLIWPEEGGDLDEWRSRWRSAFRLRHRETIATAKELSVRLAQLARDIRDRIGTVLAVESKRGPLRKLLEAFQQSLVADLDEKGFADMYAQTIAYGLLSARIVDPEHRTTEDFAGHMRTSPFLRELMESFIKLGGRKRTEGGAGLDFDELGVSEVVELLDDANMEAVVRDFGRQNQQEDPVIHFYEHFLNYYDPGEKKKRGVFYTPKPVVTYIVRSVDELLRTEFGLADGLGDIATWGEMAKRHAGLKIPEGTSPDQAFVQILDPATGTGTFLVEVIEIVHATMMEKWKGEGVRSEKALNKRWNEYVPQHLLPRLHGYELMMAPYAIAHLKIGLKLYETGYRFESEGRARIYLTNSLEPPQDHTGKLKFAIPALAHEAQEVREIKQCVVFTIVLGNPPYSINSGNLEPEHRALVDRYRYVDGERIKERGALQFEKNIQDDYVKFFAFAEDALTISPAAILGYVSNGNYLDASTLRGLRASLINKFSVIQLTDLHGDGSGSGLVGAGGKDENVFDIQQGVAIGIYCRSLVGESRAHRLDCGGSKELKFAFLSKGGFNLDWATEFEPTPPSYGFFGAGEHREFWEKWPLINDIFQQYSAGIITARDAVVISEHKEELARSINQMRASKLPNKEFLKKFCIPDKKGWDVTKARTKLKELDDVRKEIIPVAYRPFDNRSIFYHQSLVWGRAYPTMRHALRTNNLLIGVCKQLHKRTDPWRHVYVCRTLGESSLVSNKSKEVTSFFPLLLTGEDGGLLENRVSLNVADLRACFPGFNGVNEKPERQKRELCGYIYAILNAPSYREKFRDDLARDFPRIPITAESDFFETLAELGDDLVALHLLESEVLEKPNTAYAGPASPEVVRPAWSDGTVWLDAAKTNARAGHRATKPGMIGFEGVSEEVWDFHIGAYQVCHKWLKDRKGRMLTDEDIAHYQKIVVAISETIRIMGEIDEVIDQHGGWPGAFQVDEDEQDAMPLRQAAEEKGKYGTKD